MNGPASSTFQGLQQNWEIFILWGEKVGGLNEIEESPFKLMGRIHKCLSNTGQKCSEEERGPVKASSPVQLVLLISSAGRFVLQVTVSSLTLRTVKTVVSRFFSSCSDLEELKAASQSRMSFTICFWKPQTGGGRESSSPAAEELRVGAGQLHEELVLHLQRRLSEGRGRSVVQGRRPADVHRSRTFSLSFSTVYCLIHDVAERLFFQTWSDKSNITWSPSCSVGPPSSPW